MAGGRPRARSTGRRPSGAASSSSGTAGTATGRSTQPAAVKAYLDPLRGDARPALGDDDRAGHRGGHRPHGGDELRAPHRGPHADRPRPGGGPRPPPSLPSPRPGGGSPSSTRRSRRRRRRTTPAAEPASRRRPRYEKDRVEKAAAAIAGVKMSQVPLGLALNVLGRSPASATTTSAASRPERAGVPRRLRQPGPARDPARLQGPAPRRGLGDRPLPPQRLRAHALPDALAATTSGTRASS